MDKSIDTHWEFILNTDNLLKVEKIINRIRAILGLTFKQNSIHKYEKGGYRLFCESQCESNYDLRRKLCAFCSDWICTPYPFQGNTFGRCKTTGVTWGSFWISE